MRALKSRRVQAGAKYWTVLTLMLVGTLLLQYFVPPSARYGPSFGYSAAAIGMSDRVEATVFKVSDGVWVCSGASLPAVSTRLRAGLPLKSRRHSHHCCFAALICFAGLAVYQTPSRSSSGRSRRLWVPPSAGP